MLEEFNKGNKFKTSFVDKTDEIINFNELVDRTVEKMVSEILGKKINQLDGVVKNLILYHDPYLKDLVEQDKINKLSIINSIRKELIRDVTMVVYDTLKLNQNGTYMEKKNDNLFFGFSLN